MSDLEAILETGGAAAAELAASAVVAARRKVCPNCDAELSGPYCAACGQPTETHRRSVKDLISDFVADIITWDSRILRTLRALLFQPGELSLAFREGRTQRYVPAVRLYLFVSLLFFLLLSATGTAFMQFDVHIDDYKLAIDKDHNLVQVHPDGKRTPLPGFRVKPNGDIYPVFLPDHVIHEMKLGEETANISSSLRLFDRIGAGPKLSKADADTLRRADADMVKDVKSDKHAGWIALAAEQTVDRLVTNPAALNGPLTTWIPRILFLLLPLFALLLSLFYIRQRKAFYFVDHMVFSLNLHSAAFAFLTVAALIAQFAPGTWLFGATVLVMSVYFALALKRCYQQRWPITLLKFAGISFLYTAFLLMPALAAAITLSVLYT